MSRPINSVGNRARLIPIKVDERFRAKAFPMNGGQPSSRL